MKPLALKRGARALRHSSRAGFTLIELMVVVIIIGMMGGVAMVSWQALLPNQQFNTAVRKLSEDLHQTRSDAISQNRPYEMRYDIERDSYRVKSPFKKNGGFATEEDDPDRLWVRETDLEAEGVDIVSVTIDDRTYDSGEVFIRFDPLGASSYHAIVLRHAKFERFYTIEAMPLTGDIRFHDGLFEREPAQPEDFD